MTGTFTYAQTAQDEGQTAAADHPKTTIKLHEFQRVGDCELSAWVDQLIFSLEAQPDARGYVISYSSRDVLPSQIGQNIQLERMRKGFAFRKYDPNRIVFIDGGYRETPLTEIYVVPFGGVPPEPTESLPAPAVPKTTYLWSRGGFASDEDWIDLDDYLRPEVIRERERQVLLENASAAQAAEADGTSEPIDETSEATPASDLDDRTAEEIEEDRYRWIDESFGEQVAQTKSSHGVIIFYADEEQYDIGALQGFIASGRDKVAERANIRPSQIQLVFGGYRGGVDLEYWIVPNKGKAPPITPEDRPPPEQE